MVKISCIIAAHNEESRIETVLQVVYKHPLINEVIVIDDGSKDNTKDIVKKYKEVKLIAYKKNKGKSYAIAMGAANSKGNIIFLLDADLLNLTPNDISDLIRPILLKRADISISLRKNAPWLYRKIGLDFISGERVFSKKLIKNNLEEIKNLPSYGLEVYLNKLIIKNKCRIKIVFWGGVISPWKHQKGDFFKGLKGEFNMILNILKVISIFEAGYQILKMISLKVE